MSMPLSILGQLETKNVNIGAWRFFAGPYDTYIDEFVKFGPTVPPSPFLDMGVADQSSSVAFTKTLFKYMAGVPKVLKAVKIVSLDFTLNLNLDEFSGANLARAIYSTNYAIKKYASSPAVALASAVPVGNVVQVASGPAFTEQQFIGLASSSVGLATTTEEHRIVEISGNYLLLNRDVVTVYGSAPYIGQIESWKIPFGGPAVNQIAIVGVWDTVIEGVQFVVAIPRAVIDGNWTSGGIPATSHQKIQMQVTGQAFYDIDLGDNSVANLLRFAA